MDLRPGEMIGPVASAVTDVRRQLDELASTTAKASSAAQLLPPMLGSSGKRTYLLAFQNNAEARGTRRGGYTWRDQSRHSWSMTPKHRR